jgi:hypothetical protein
MPKMPVRRGWRRVAIVAIAVLAGVIALRRSVFPVDPPGRHAISTATPVAPGERRAEVIVLIDSRGPDANDFAHLVEPYLSHFGVPFALLDIATAEVGADVGDHSLIVVGHRGVVAALAPPARAAIDAAVATGTGIVAFDDNLWDGTTPRLQVVTHVAARATGVVGAASISFTDPATIRLLALAEDGHQSPALPTLDAGETVVTTDGQWTERSSHDSPNATIFAGLDEAERHGLPPIRFAATDVAPGVYDAIAEVYTGPPGGDVRYAFGLGGEAPDTRHLDAIGGSGGARDHAEYALGRLSVGASGFTMHVHDADALRGAPSVFGWRRVRLVPAAASDRAPSYIGARHAAWEQVPTASFTLLRVEPAAGEVPAYAGSAPLLLTGRQGAGRVVLWTSYEWMRPEVRGPLGGLDDLMWRSLVWAARKPFVLQLLPPIVTMRMDDESGPLDWLHTAVAVGFKPWVGVFLSDLDDAESRELAAIVRSGAATASVHSFDASTFFYYDHSGRRAWPTATMAANWRRATDWHRRYDLPMSSYIVPHFYEIGANALPLLTDAGAEFLVTHMAPGGAYGMPWLRSGPFRRWATGISTAAVPVYYADEVPGSGRVDAPGLFNCVTEIRDDAGYEWFPTPDVDATVARGVRQLSRALDSRVLATLFTHGYFIPAIAAADWRTILERTLAGVAAHAPLQMTMDAACRFVRDQHTSAISAVRVVEGTGNVRLTVTGRAAAPTTVSVFTEDATGITERTVAVPAFTGTAEVSGDPLPARQLDERPGRR